jgi:hypothetical protein
MVLRCTFLSCENRRKTLKNNTKPEKVIHAYNLSIQRPRQGCHMFQTNPVYKVTQSPNPKHRPGGTAQAVECFHNNHETLSSNSTTTKTNK